MTDVKTKLNDASVEDFLNSIEDDQKRQDSFRLVEIYQDITGEPARMWGTSIIGFGKYHYKSEKSSQEADWMLAGFSPRKSALTLYGTAGSETSQKILEKLGKYKTGKGCLYIKKLSDVDQKVLNDLIQSSFDEAKKIHKVD